MAGVVLKVDAGEPEPSVINQAAASLKAGKLVAFPTDTVYGIGADVFNEDAVNQIFTAKGRSYDKPLQVLIANRKDLKVIAEYESEVLTCLALEFWPGPLTIVIPARKDFPRWVTCGRETVGVRMPANTIAMKLIAAFGGPIAATSANISGFPDPVNAEEVMKYLNGKVDLIIDSGSTPGNIPSTVLDISVHPPVILRQGKLSAEEINRVLAGI